MDNRLELVLSLNGIYQSVHEVSADVGLKQNMVGQLTKQGFQRTATTENDEDFLKGYVQEACNLLTSTFHRYFPLLSVDEHYLIVDGEVQYDRLYKEIRVSFQLPSNAAKRLVRTLEPLLTEYFKYYILYKWFVNVDNNEASVYKSQVDTSLASIRRMLNERDAPVRTIPTEATYEKTKYE